MIKKIPVKLNYLLCILVLVLVLVYTDATGQTAIEKKKTRRAFSQSNIGLDLLYIFNNGNTGYFNEQKQLAYTKVGNQATTRLVISSLYFWGYTDFYANINLSNKNFVPLTGVTNNYYDAESGMKLYPARLRKNCLSPFIGMAWSTISYEQSNTANSLQGVKMCRSRFPVSAGLSMLIGNSGFLDMGVKYITSTNYDYYIDRNTITPLKLPSLSGWLGLRWIFLKSYYEKKEDRQEGNEIIKEEIKTENRKNFISVSLGVSNSYFIYKSSYNSIYRPYMDQFKCSAYYPDFGIGYYYSKLRAQLNLAYRDIQSTLSAYDVYQHINNKFITLEVYKFLFSYNGITPFAGLGAGYQNFQFLETETNTIVNNKQVKSFVPCFTLGWDVRFNKIKWLSFRSNVHYTPKPAIEMAGGTSLRLNQLEFNVIQAVFYPQLFGKNKRA